MYLQDLYYYDKQLPESDPYASLLFPEENLSQEYEQFPKIIDCMDLKQSACKSIIFQELSRMDISSINTIHDLIFITDFNKPSKPVFDAVSSVLDSLHIFWFQGVKDGRIYVTRDALMYFYRFVLNVVII